MKNNHFIKSKNEQEHFIRDIMDKKEEPTKPEKGYGTLDKDELDNINEISPMSRKFIKTRLYIHFKEYWYRYLFGLVGGLAIFYFLTLNVKLAEINKDISYQYLNTNENTRKIEKVSDDIILLREQMLILSGDFKSLNDRFAMFIELFKNKE
jgi:hypothetical protein